MQRYSKLVLLYFLSIILITILYCFTAIYIQDPLQVWHKHFFRKEITYTSNIREAARAMIRNEQFDSVIIGNSHSQNTSCEYAKNLFGGKFINLSIAGSTFYEKNIILKYLLRKKKIKRIFYTLDEHYLDLSKEPLLYDTNQYTFLYNNNIFDDIKIYWNDKYLFEILFFNNLNKYIGEIRNMDKPFAWENYEELYRRFGGFDNWIQNKDDEQLKVYFKSILETPLSYSSQILPKEYKKDLHNYIDKYLFTNFKQAPNTEFYIIISPISNIEMARRLRENKQYWAKHFEFLQYLITSKEKYKNFKVYAFNNDINIGKIEYYKDATHYKTEINHYILKSIKENKYELTAENIDKYKADTYNIAKQFNYEYYYNKIKKAVETN